MATEVLEKAKVVINVDECKGCGYCIAICPSEALSFAEGLNKYGFHPAQWSGNRCSGCGFCYYTCPEPGAITIMKKGHKVNFEELRGEA